MTDCMIQVTYDRVQNVLKLDIKLYNIRYIVSYDREVNTMLSNSLLN